MCAGGDTDPRIGLRIFSPKYSHCFPYYLLQESYVSGAVCLLVCLCLWTALRKNYWPDWLPWNLVERCSMGRGITHTILEWIRLKRRLHEFSFTLANVVRCSIWPWRRYVLSEFLLFCCCHTLLLAKNTAISVALQWVDSLLHLGHGQVMAT